MIAVLFVQGMVFAEILLNLCNANAVQLHQGGIRFVFFRCITPLRITHFLFLYGFSSVMPYAHNQDFDTPKSCGMNWSKIADIEPKYRCNAPSKQTWYIVVSFIALC
jgi:hypothetical protein